MFIGLGPYVYSPSLNQLSPLLVGRGSLPVNMHQCTSSGGRPTCGRVCFGFGVCLFWFVFSFLCVCVLVLVYVFLCACV